MTTNAKSTTAVQGTSSANTQNSAISSNPKLQEKKEQTPVKQLTPPALTIEDKIRKIEVLNKLIAKRDKIKDYELDLNNFKVSNDKFTSNLTLKDNAGHIFQTSRPELVTEVIDLLLGKAKTALEEVNAEIETAY